MWWAKILILFILCWNRICFTFICVLVGYYAAWSGNNILTFWDSLSAPSSGVKKSNSVLHYSVTLKHVVNILPRYLISLNLCNISRQWILNTYWLYSFSKWIWLLATLNKWKFTVFCCKGTVHHSGQFCKKFYFHIVPQSEHTWYIYNVYFYSFVVIAVGSESLCGSVNLVSSHYIEIWECYIRNL
jgi:hypothetical protein